MYKCDDPHVAAGRSCYAPVSAAMRILEWIVESWTGGYRHIGQGHSLKGKEAGTEALILPARSTRYNNALREASSCDNDNSRNNCPLWRLFHPGIPSMMPGLLCEVSYSSSLELSVLTSQDFIEQSSSNSVAQRLKDHVHIYDSV